GVARLGAGKRVANTFAALTCTQTRGAPEGQALRQPEASLQRSVAMPRTESPLQLVQEPDPSAHWQNRHAVGVISRFTSPAAFLTTSRMPAKSPDVPLF